MSAEEVQKEREKQREFQAEQNAVQQAFNSQGNLRKDIVEDLLDTEDIRVGDSNDLEEVTVSKIQSMLSKQWILSNLTGAQEHDIRYKLEVMKIKVLGTHPPDESAITGATRAFIYNDPMEELKPLTQQERILIDELFETLKALATRGREGFERQQINTNIARTETENQSQKEKSGWTGLFDS